MDASASRLLFTGLVALMALMRLGELAVCRRNLRWLKAQGAVEWGAGHYPVMVALHGAFLVSCLTEVWLLRPPWRPALGVAMLLVLTAAAALRWWAMAVLGRRWTTRVVPLPGTPPVERGPYRYLRHPNYLAVAVEIAALPLVHGAWITALVFSAANTLLLRARIRVEEEALSAALAGPAPAGERPFEGESG